MEMPHVTLQFEPRDLWIGIYWKKTTELPSRFLVLYICLVPTLPLVVTIKTGSFLRPTLRGSIPYINGLRPKPGWSRDGNTFYKD